MSIFYVSDYADELRCKLKFYHTDHGKYKDKERR